MCCNSSVRAMLANFSFKPDVRGEANAEAETSESEDESGVEGAGDCGLGVQRAESSPFHELIRERSGMSRDVKRRVASAACCDETSVDKRDDGHGRDCVDVLTPHLTVREREQMRGPQGMEAQAGAIAYTSWSAALIICVTWGDGHGTARQTRTYVLFFQGGPSGSLSVEYVGAFDPCTFSCNLADISPSPFEAGSVIGGLMIWRSFNGQSIGADR
ncbi:hypothetical protein B0H17DRAFT_1134470 [Mycena rosella]|uniref:Uncharacterized protein n=1 Tax=Mycena rosella TaxID=1033263 RepID=A0AAD7DG66_MYCRO|nr:hypothetical protein B0H17DRAFT_1134470 [Mycena rosella]